MAGAVVVVVAVAVVAGGGGAVVDYVVAVDVADVVDAVAVLVPAENVEVVVAQSLPSTLKKQTVLNFINKILRSISCVLFSRLWIPVGFAVVVVVAAAAVVV